MVPMQYHHREFSHAAFDPFLFFFMLAMLSAPPSVVAQRRIVVGMFEETPLIFTDSKGHHRGIAVDLLDYIARQEKWTLQYLPGTRSQCVKRLKTGIVDLLPGLAELKKREKALQLGKESILTDWGQMYIHPDTPPAHLLDFTGRDIAFAEKDPYTPAFETMLTVLEIHPQMIKAADYKSVLSLVHQKKVSAGIVSRIYGAYGEKHFKVKRSPISFCPVKLCFAVLKDRNTDILITLDAYLKKLKATPPIHLPSIPETVDDGRQTGDLSTMAQAAVGPLQHYRGNGNHCRGQCDSQPAGQTAYRGVKKHDRRKRENRKRTGRCQGYTTAACAGPLPFYAPQKGIRYFRLPGAGP